jgi:adenylate kinase family enzyme
LEKEYGKKNILVFLLRVRPKSSIFRNSNRKVCSICGTPILYSEKTHKHRNCPLCGGKLRTRTLDKPEIIKIRLKEYKNRTKPIVAELKRRGYKILEINGEPAPTKVYFAILKKLGLKGNDTRIRGANYHELLLRILAIRI